MRPQGSLRPGPTVLALLVGVLAIIGTGVLVRNTEMVTGRYVQHGIPPVPAFAWLLLCAVLPALWMRVGARWVPDRRLVLLVYVMLTVGTILSGPYHLRAFLPHLVTLRYQERPDGNMSGGKLSEHIPAWLAPTEPAVIKGYFEADRIGGVPWAAWSGPILVWSGFLLALFVFSGCLMLLVRQRWTEEERLSFPLLSLPLTLSGGGGEVWGGSKSTGLFWLGFGFAACFNALNIARVFAPGMPAPGFYVAFTDLFVDRPWIPLGSVTLFNMLEVIGVGYLVPLEVSFSAWFFYLLNRAIAVAGMAAGYDKPGFPYTQDAAAGGYVAVGLMLLWGLRKSLGKSISSVFSRRGDPVERWAWIGLLGSATGVCVFFAKAGFDWRLSWPFFAILALFTLVYARIRAETGVPLGFIYPFGLPKEGLVNALGFDQIMGWAGPGSLVMFSTFAWMSRHHAMEEMAAYQLDSAKLGREARLPTSLLVGAVLLAVCVGLGVGFWVHLDTFYSIGSNLAGGGNGTGEFRATVALQEFQALKGRLAAPPPRNWEQIQAQGAGLAFTAVLQWVRMKWIGSPFHPLGFLIGTSYGDSSNSFFPLFIAWLFKAILLRTGGLRWYRAGIPVFLGLAIGHYFFVGILWPILATAVGEASAAYLVYFGG
jgi:hypothetical protein